MLRLDLPDFDNCQHSDAFEIRRALSRADARAINDLYAKRGMVPSQIDFINHQSDSNEKLFLVAEDRSTHAILGTVMGLDHVELFGDPSNGSSLWCLAVDPAAMVPGIGESLVRSLAGYFKDAGRQYMDLSVIHDNRQAQALYKKLGFRPVRIFAVKTKNAHNESLFLGPELEDELNPYAQIIVDEARARGISADVLDGEQGYFRLSRGGKSITCRESLSELTSAIAMSRCQDKNVTHGLLKQTGLVVPAFQHAGTPEANRAFLEEYGRIVVKPAMGEQGKGITIGISSPAELDVAIEHARGFGEKVLLESFHSGSDLRIVVINNEVVAAAIRRPASVVGDGKTTARVLIKKQSRRRQAATSGESKIPLDDSTRECLQQHGYDYDDVIPAGELVTVRDTANLHTGGTIHDVTKELHPSLAEVAIKAARALEIPVVGLDLIVASPESAEYVIIEANERPGLANHEPQPTAKKFIDLLFPLSFAANDPQPGQSA